VLGYFFPRALLPVWRGWMKLAHYVSIVMTFVILAAAWTIGFVPMAYLLKVLRIKAIDLSYKAKVTSYWETRDPKYDDFKRLELQY
jgi:general stress protein CsbA